MFPFCHETKSNSHTSSHVTSDINIRVKQYNVQHQLGCWVYFSIFYCHPTGHRGSIPMNISSPVPSSIHPLANQTALYTRHTWMWLATANEAGSTHIVFGVDVHTAAQNHLHKLLVLPLLVLLHTDTQRKKLYLPTYYGWSCFTQDPRCYAFIIY